MQQQELLKHYCPKLLRPRCSRFHYIPKGMLLWNLRRSGFNVKKFVRNSINTAGNNARFNNNELQWSTMFHRWVTESKLPGKWCRSYLVEKHKEKLLYKHYRQWLTATQEIRDDLTQES